MHKKLNQILCLIMGIFVFSVSLKAAPPAAPGNLKHTLNTTSAIYWRWDDNSNNEQGFKCYEWYYEKVGSDWVYLLSHDPVWSVNANIVSYTETGLAPNTQYRRIIQAWNTDGISPSSWVPYRVAFYTAIEPPAGLAFGPKGFDFLSKKARLTVKLTPPLPSNLTTTDSFSRFGYFVPNDSGFYIEEITTGKT
ncbi:MAG: fibronectin type III domain-containing protein [Candidatus Ratteibacteria bacterium]